jgi:hypothetical protein
MHLSEYQAQKGNRYAQEGNPSVRCNALSKTRKSVNVYLKPVQAIEFARHLLQKAQLVLQENIEDAVVQVWNVGEDNESLSIGLTQARKGRRRKKGQGAGSADAKSHVE